MASDTKNVKMGVCQIFFDNQDMGYTIGGVEVSVTTETRETKIDQFGQTPINNAITGRKVSVKAPLAETTLRNLLKTMPGAKLVTDGVQAGGTVTFTAQPTAAQKVSIAGTDFTFQAGNPTAVTQVKIGTNLAASIENLVNAVNLSGLAVVAFNGTVTYADGVWSPTSNIGTVFSVRAADPGTAGNSVTLTTNVTGATASGGTLTGGVAETRARVDVSTGVGVDLLSIAKTLRLHPKGKAATDLSEDFTVFKTASAGALQFAYKVDAERIYNAEFIGFPDVSNGDKLFAVGDPLAV